MTQSFEPVSDFDLHAYIDGQLDMRRRAEVEDYLSRNPDAAVRVMADLRVRDLLRLSAPDPASVPRFATVDAARRLRRGLARSRFFGGLRRVAAVGLLVAAGWGAHSLVGSVEGGGAVASAATPAFVREALASHRIALVRAAMHSQPAARDFDPEEIRAATDIVLPRLPEGWQLLDHQIFPADEGASVEMVIDTDEAGRISLFAVRAADFDVTEPTLADEDGQTAAFWQLGGLAYAVMGEAPGPAIGAAAQRLAASLY